MKQELKIALVLDDYKLNNKEDLWRRSLDMQPDIERNYDFVREEIGPGITPKTTTCVRYYKLKAGRSM